MADLLCPRCKVPMLKAAGLDGYWICPRRPDHEFCEESEYAAQDMAQRRVVIEAREEERQKPQPRRCPRCNAKAKQNGKGRWFCDNAVAHATVYLLPEEGDPGWLDHLGIKEPLPPVQQANIGDGGACLFRGVFAAGGGGGSGRKRKKPTKKQRGPREFFDF